MRFKPSMKKKIGKDLSNMSQLFTLDECYRIIEYMESINGWKQSSGSLASYSSIPFTPDKWIQSKIIKYCKDTIGIDIQSVDCVGLKYEVGDLFPPHTDRHENKEFYKDFLYNINMILNNDYTGGEFKLKGVPFIHNPGVVYHYNSYELHEVTEITSGIRYSILFYIRERDFNYKKPIL
jgi:hypothetical protein